MTIQRILPLLALAIPVFPSFASAAPRLLVTDQLAGTVLEFTDGGEATVFASGLSEPAGLCVGPGNDVYVSEYGTGEMAIISAGGDMTDEPAFADTTAAKGINLVPVGLWCNDSVVLVSDLQGAVANVVVGGSDPLAWQVYAYWPAALNPFPIDIAQSDAGNVFVTSASGIFRADLGLTGEAPPIVTGHPFVAMEAVGETLLATVADGPRIYDVSMGGDLTDAAPWATLPGDGSVFALLAAGSQRYAASGTAIYDVTGGGDLTAADPYATGLSEGLLYQAMVEWTCGTDADCDDGDACNGAETCEANTCIPAAEPLSCDDDDVCTADACDPESGCANEPIEGCCVSDLDCSLDEICDEDANVCVPAYSPTTGDDSTSGDGSSTGDDDEEETGNDVPLPSGTSGDAPETGDVSGGETGEGDTDGASADAASSGCTVAGRSGSPRWITRCSVNSTRCGAWWKVSRRGWPPVTRRPRRSRCCAK